MEERMTDISTHMVDEEEKVKHLTKQRNKYEAIIADLEQRLKQEQQVGRVHSRKKGIYCMVEGI